MHLLLSLMLIVSLSIAQMPQPKYKLKMTTIEKKACKNIKRDKLCYKVSLEYPFIDILRDDIANILQKKIKTTKYNLFKDDPYSKIANIDEAIISNNWFSKNTIELFDYYKDFVTVSLFSIDYLGGAHPNSTLKLYPFDATTSKIVTIKDIIPNKDMDIFYQIAKRAYKIYAGLLPYEPLTKDGWFENDFILPNGFAITEDGLLFSYSPYEIKAYAYGYTYFILPYYMLKDIIDQDSIIYDIVKSSTSPTKKEIDKDLGFNGNKGKLKTTLKYIGNHKFEIDIFANLTKDYRYIWLSIGLPQYKSAKEVYVADYKGFDRFSIYPAGSKIFNVDTKRAMRSKYLLVEGSKKRYLSYDDLFAKIIFKAPKSLDAVCIEIRLTVKNRKVENLIDDGFIDQQGFLSQRLCLPNIKN